MPHACGARAFAEPRVAGLPNSVRTGESIDIAWSELPVGTHEVELEVSIEGGNWKRISPELEAHAGHFAWRVPAGMHGNARVRLRLGSEHGEVDSAPSEPFWIEGPTSSGPTWLDEDGRWDARGGFGHVMPSELVDAVPALRVRDIWTFASARPDVAGLLSEAKWMDRECEVEGWKYIRPVLTFAAGDMKRWQLTPEFFEETT